MNLTIVLFYLHAFFGSLDFARGLFIIFLLNRGLSMGEVGILQTVLFWSNLSFEVPAGLLADRFKRKYSVALGLILTAIAALLMPTVDGWIYGAFVFGLHGMGFAFRSGADSALLYDELQKAGPEWSEHFVSVSARARSVSTVAMVIAIAAGGFLQSRGWDILYLSFAICMIVAAILIMAIPESPHQRDTECPKELGVFKLLASIKAFLTTHDGKSLLFFILGMGFIEAAHAPFFIYFQNFLKIYRPCHCLADGPYFDCLPFCGSL
jgi:MFS family permease